MRITMASGTLLILTLTGCGGGLSSGDVRVRTDRLAYVAPGTAEVTVRNDWHENLFLSSCALLERRDGNRWLASEEPVCPADLVALRPGESHRFVRGLGGQLGPGTYRFRVPMSLQGVPFQPVEDAFVSLTFSITPVQPRVD
jgi:hypothetical protein